MSVKKQMPFFRRKFLKALIFVFLLGICNFLSAQYANIDSLKVQLLSVKEDTNKVKLLNQLSLDLYNNSDYNHGMQYSVISRDLSQKLGYDKGTARAYNTIGIILLDQGNYSESVKNNFAALKIWEKINNKKGIANSYGNIAIAYKLQGNYEEALKNNFEALRIRKETGHKGSICGSYNNIGNVYVKIAYRAYEAKEFEKSNEYYELALKNFANALVLAKETEEKQSIANALINAGLVYSEQGNIALVQKDIKMANSKFEKALKNYFQAITLYEDIKDLDGIVAVNINVSAIYFARKKYKESEAYILKALELAKEIGALERISNALSSLKNIYYETGRYNLALQRYKEYILTSDSLINEENTRKTVESKMQYAFDKKTTADSIRHVEQLKQNALKHERDVKQQQRYTYGGLIGFVLMIAVASVSFRAYRQKQKSNEIISEQKHSIVEKQKEILDSIYYARRIQQSLLPKEKYIQRKLTK